MNKITTIGLTAAALMACAGAASAGSVETASQTVSFTFTPGVLTHTFSFTGFNNLGIPPLTVGAVLVGVHDSLTSTFTETGVITNTTPAGGLSVTYTGTAGDTATKVMPTPIGTLTATGSAPFSTTLAAGATGTVTLTGTASAGSTTFTTGLGAFLTNFTALGTDSGFFAITGGTPFTLVATSTSTIKDVLTYSFTEPVTTTPEPATLSLLGVGLVGLGLARRRRRNGAKAA